MAGREQSGFTPGLEEKYLAGRRSTMGDDLAEEERVLPINALETTPPSGHHDTRRT